MTTEALGAPLITNGDILRGVSLVEQLRALIRERAKDVNQKELAESLGLSQGYVSMILSGKRLGNEVATLAELARVLKTDLSTLIAEAERRDLPRHSRTGQQALQREEGPDATAAARIRQLEGRLTAHEAILTRISRLAVEIATASGTKSDTATPRKRRRSGSHRTAD